MEETDCTATLRHDCRKCMYAAGEPGLAHSCWFCEQPWECLAATIHTGIPLFYSFGIDKIADVYKERPMEDDKSVDTDNANSLYNREQRFVKPTLSQEFKKGSAHKSSPRSVLQNFCHHSQPHGPLHLWSYGNQHWGS